MNLFFAYLFDFVIGFFRIIEVKFDNLTGTQLLLIIFILIMLCFCKEIKYIINKYRF